MRVMGNLFVVRQMALTAVSGCLIPVLKAGGIGMTGRTSKVGMGRISIIFCSDQRCGPSGSYLGLGPAVSVTVQTQAFDLLLRLCNLGPRCYMTSHTGSIFFGKARKLVAFFVAGTALLRRRPLRVISALIVIQHQLFMGIVAGQTVFILFGIVYFLSAVHPAVQVFLNLVVALGTSVLAEKGRQIFVNVGRVGMKRLIGGVGMAFPTGKLAVGGYVKSFGIEQPAGLHSHPRESNKQNRSQGYSDCLLYTSDAADECPAV